MFSKKQKTLNSQVYSFVINRLKLKRREKIIFYRLLGFLIRNDKPFPYSTKAISDISGYSRSSVFECLNILEQLRLITRIGHTSRIRFVKGSLMVKICTLVQNRINRNQINNCTLVQKLEKPSSASPVSGYHKTSSLLKLKDKELTQFELQQIKFYKNNPHLKPTSDDKYLFED